jgi:hypothetical protein
MTHAWPKTWSMWQPSPVLLAFGVGRVGLVDEVLAVEELVTEVGAASQIA